MKRHIMGYTATLALALGCQTSPDGDLETASDFSKGLPPEAAECMAEQCFDITAEKDISFIAVETETCPEALVTLHLSEPGGPELALTPTPHGQGKSCEGIAPDALKFDGLSRDHYVLCVRYHGSASVGDIRITTKAGQVCEVMSYDGDCSGCEPANGDGGQPGTGGADAGGNDGKGGKGGKDYGGHGGDCP
jgi:hypothetical protein